MRTLRRLLYGLVLLALLAAGGLAAALQVRPSLAPWTKLVLAPAPPAAPGLRVAWAGVSTLAITDGETTILTDGFFTRPALFRTAAGLIAPDEDRVVGGLDRLGITRAAAVVVLHSHYDHAMDAPLAADRTGALLVGSESTANVARGMGLPEDRIHVTHAGDELRFGAFTVRLLPSRHFPHGMAMGAITAPLVPPAPATAYRVGDCYTVVVSHPAGTLLVQGSAGFEPGALAGVRADVVLLGVAGLGTKPGSYQRDYWRAVVGTTRPALVVPIHWDDFTRPATEPLVPMPRLLDDFEATMTFLEHRTEVAGAPALGLLPAWQYVALPPAARRDVVADSR